MTKGPLITIAINHSAVPETQHAREMTDEELESAHTLWTRKRPGRYERDEQSMMLRKEADRQLRRIRAEQKRRKRQCPT